MGSNTGTVWQEAQKKQIASVFQRKAGLKVPMDLFTLIPRTIIGVTYPAFASLKAVLSDSPESWSLAEILGGSWRIFPGGIIVGPPDKSAELFLPSLSHPQVQLPGLVHGPSGVERERRHLQQYS